MNLPPEFQDDDPDPEGFRQLMLAIIVCVLFYGAIAAFLIQR